MSTGVVAQPLTRALLRWLLGRREALASPDPTTGRCPLAYGSSFRIVAVLMLAVSTAFVILGIVAGQGDPKAMTIFLLIFGSMWAASLWAIYETFVVRIEISRDGIYRRTREGAELHLPWSTVTKVSYSESMNWLVYRAEGHGVVRISIFRGGLATLASMSAEHLPGEAARMAGALLEAAATGPGIPR